MVAYRPRVADSVLAEQLGALGAVLVEGPKACGKTATASRAAQTTFRLDTDDNARAAVALNPLALFEQPTPILFDEWQVEPRIWNQIRRHVDDRGDKGLYILTGSATPRDEIDRHSGAGRIGTMRMRPFSLFESGDSSGEVSLQALLAGEEQRGRGTDLSIPELMKTIVVGGWPTLLDADEAEARIWLTGYLRQIAEVDVPALGTRRNPRNIRRLLESLARNVSQSPKLTEIARDVAGERSEIAPATLSAYLDALDRLMLTEQSEPWQPHMRSKTRLRSAPVRYFTDPSLGTAALGVGSADLLSELNAAGFHFEGLAVRDLRIYAEPLSGTISSWRDANGNEVDAVVTLPGGRWAAFEVKLNPDDADRAAASLLRFAESVDTTRHGAPSALVVVTSGGYAGRRPQDGVHVVPLTALGP